MVTPSMFIIPFSPYLRSAQELQIKHEAVWRAIGKAPAGARLLVLCPLNSGHLCPVVLVLGTFRLLPLAQRSTLVVIITPSVGKADVSWGGGRGHVNTTWPAGCFHLLAPHLNCVTVLHFFRLASHHVFWVDLMNCMV